MTKTSNKTNEITEFVKHILKSWDEAKNNRDCESKSNKSSQTRRKKKNIQWDRPNPNFVKLNFDGSKWSNGSSAYGFIIRDASSRVLAKGFGKIPNMPIFETESISLLMGLTKLQEMGYRKIEIEGDNLNVINCIQGIWKPPWQAEILIGDLLALIQSFEEVRIKHIFREVNTVADALASLGHLSPAACVDIPQTIEDLIRNDALRRPVHRISTS